MTKSLVYSGPHPEFVIDELDTEQVLKVGVPFDAPDDLAARLLEQNTFALAGTKSPVATPQAVAQAATAASTPDQADDATKAAS